MGEKGGGGRVGGEGEEEEVASLQLSGEGGSGKGFSLPCRWLLEAGGSPAPIMDNLGIWGGRGVLLLAGPGSSTLYE